MILVYKITEVIYISLFYDYYYENIIYTKRQIYIVVVVQLLNCVWLFVTPWTAACQTSLSITNSQSLLKLMSIKLVMPSNHLILCHPLVLLPSIFPRIRVFSNELALHISWPNIGASASASVLQWILRTDFFLD